MAKEYNDRQHKPLREQYQVEALVEELAQALDSAHLWNIEQGQAS